MIKNNKKHFWRHFGALLLLPVLLLIMPVHAHASTQDFVITDFKADYTLSKQNKHGSLHIIEDIKLTYNDYNHGILRAIPESYKGHSLQLHVNSVSSPSGAPSKFTTYSSNGNLVIKIGDAARTITGVQDYTIDYTADNVIGFYNDHDELYWDINGDQWQQPFDFVELTLHLPSDLKLSSNKPVCFAGSYGVNDSTGCSISADGNTVTAFTNKMLTATQTLSVVVGFEKGYFAPYTTADKLAEYAKFIAPILILPSIIGGYAFNRWRKVGRDPKGAGTVVPEYEAPDDLRPIEVGAILHFKADNPGVTATIIDLAVRGYIKIIEKKKDRLIGKDKLEYTLEITNNDFSKLTSYEISIMRGLFFNVTNYNIGGQVHLSTLKDKFYTTAKTVQENVVKGLVEKSYFNGNPISSGGRLHLVGGIMFTLAFFLGGKFGASALIAVLLSAVVSIGFGLAMPARTQKGVEAKDKINGLKLYLETAEKDRIAMLQAPDAKYASSHELPEKTVELFEKLLPYAMVLGVENEWANQFKDIYSQPPDWYSGNWSAFNTGLLIGSLNNSVGALNTVAFSSPSSSGSSGFGGGGFSGGGGGGGGGGGW